MHVIGATQLWHTGNNELMIHCLNHNTDCLEEKRQILIDELASARVGHIDDQNDAGQTAMMFAVAMNRAWSVHWLLKNGASRAVVDDKGHDVVWYAKDRGRYELAKCIEDWDPALPDRWCEEMGHEPWAAVGDPKNRVVNWPCDEAREKATAAAASRAADNDDDDDDDEPDPGFVTRRLNEEV